MYINFGNTRNFHTSLKLFKMETGSYNYTFQLPNNMVNIRPQEVLITTRPITEPYLDENTRMQVILENTSRQKMRIVEKVSFCNNIHILKELETSLKWVAVPYSSVPVLGILRNAVPDDVTIHTRHCNKPVKNNTIFWK